MIPLKYAQRSCQNANTKIPCEISWALDSDTDTAKDSNAIAVAVAITVGVTATTAAFDCKRPDLHRALFLYGWFFSPGHREISGCKVARS